MSEKKTGGKRRKYDQHFKEEVLKMISNGRSVVEVSQSLGIGENLIYRWKKRSQQGQNKQEGSGSASDLAAENARLKATLERVEQEREILKKALNIFSRGT